MEQTEKFIRQIMMKPSCGIGCVIVPSDVERQVYIDRCFSTETVSIMTQSGGMSFNNVPVSLEALQHIEFPEETRTFGSQVVFVFHPQISKPIIVAVLSKGDELFGVNWKQFKAFKSEGENFVSVIGDGRKGTLCVSIRGTENESGGKLQIRVVEPLNKGELSIFVQGSIQFIGNDFNVTTNTFKIINNEGFEVITKTAKINAEDKISLGKENYEPVVLGKTLKEKIIKPLLSSLKEDLMVSTAMGPSGLPLPGFISKITQIEAELDNILSEKVETE